MGVPATGTAVVRKAVVRATKSDHQQSAALKIVVARKMEPRESGGDPSRLRASVPIATPLVPAAGRESISLPDSWALRHQSAENDQAVSLRMDPGGDCFFAPVSGQLNCQDRGGRIP